MRRWADISSKHLGKESSLLDVDLMLLTTSGQGWREALRSLSFELVS